MDKSPNYKNPEAKMNLQDAEKYLRSVGEWHGVVKMPRDTIIAWAEFLKKKEDTNGTTTVPKKQNNKRTTTSAD